LLRDPRGRPAGLPLWPGWKGMLSSPVLVVGASRRSDAPPGRPAFRREMDRR
jgi:hypothetical protein